MPSRPNSLSRHLSRFFALIEIASIAWAIALLGLLVVVRVGGASAVSGAWGLDIPLHIIGSGPIGGSLSFGQTPLPIDRLHAKVGIDLGKAHDLVGMLAFPMALVLICKAGVLVSVCDLFRRLFRSAHQRDFYTARNIVLLRKTGATMLILTIAGLFFQKMTRDRTESFVRDRITAQGAISLTTEPNAKTGLNWDSPAEWMGLNHPELFVGLILIGLAEALRQGVRIREENELTV